MAMNLNVTADRNNVANDILILICVEENGNIGVFVLLQFVKTGFLF